jgi:hypothetical protein
MEPLQKSSNLKNKLGSLYGYMARRLKIQQAPKLTLTNDPVNAKQPFGFTGHYDHENRAIKVYITDRHPTDILRSFAHEIIHDWQNERGQLSDHDKKGYAQQDPQLRKKEMEAYLLGNIVFRDWQDEQRYGPPVQEPFLVSLDENIQITNPTKLKDVIKQMVQGLVADKIIDTYNRGLSSGGMQTPDFTDEFADKISAELGRQIDTINNKSNWENQGAMVSEVVCKGCGHWNCNYSLLPEVQMGVVRCPQCKQKMDQEGNVYGG